MIPKYHRALWSLFQSPLHCSDDDTFPTNLAYSLHCAKPDVKNFTKK